MDTNDAGIKMCDNNLLAGGGGGGERKREREHQ